MAHSPAVYLRENLIECAILFCSLLPLSSLDKIVISGLAPSFHGS